MLFAIALLALIGLWWLGRRNGRLPGGLNPVGILGIGLIAIAALLLMRGSLVVALLAAGGGYWLLRGKGGRLGRTGHLFDKLRSLATARQAPGARHGRTAMLEPAHGPRGVVIDALVLAGPLSGSQISQLNEADLRALLALCRRADPEGALLLEAYLDRRVPGWRINTEHDADARTSGPFQPGAMTEEEAYQILGLQRGASLDEIRAAHRSLMKRVHPDQGGTAEAASRLNAARDRLTYRHR